jgi:hypothetical protein
MRRRSRALQKLRPLSLMAAHDDRAFLRGADWGVRRDCPGSVRLCSARHSTAARFGRPRSRGNLVASARAVLAMDILVFAGFGYWLGMLFAG